MVWRDNPLARAVRMKSLDNTPSIEARVICASGARAKMPSVMAGSVRCAKVVASNDTSPCSRLSMVKKPVRCGGGVEKESRRPKGAGSHPSR